MSQVAELVDKLYSSVYNCIPYIQKEKWKIFKNPIQLPEIKLQCVRNTLVGINTIMHMVEEKSISLKTYQ